MNEASASKAVGRRGFFRCAGIGAVGAMAGILLLRKSRGRCLQSGICGGCAAYEDCELPQALSAKTARAKEAAG